jgi:hypothetical protein
MIYKDPRQSDDCLPPALLSAVAEAVQTAAPPPAVLERVRGKLVRRRGEDDGVDRGDDLPPAHGSQQGIQNAFFTRRQSTSTLRRNRPSARCVNR